MTPGFFRLPYPCLSQHTRECLAKIGIEEEGKGGQHGQHAILTLIAAIMHLLNVGFKSGKDAPLWSCVVCELDVGLSATRPRRWGSISEKWNVMITTKFSRSGWYIRDFSLCLLHK